MTQTDKIVPSLAPLAMPIDSIHPDPANSRRHGERNLETIKASLTRYGQRKPIVVNKLTNVIEAGNGTWDAAKALGWTQLAVVFVEDDPSTATGYMIADNRSAELATWDDQALAQHLKALAAEDQLGFTGFSADELEVLVGPDAHLWDRIDVRAELEKIIHPRCAIGEIWQLGPHRLACGDATDPVVWSRLLGDRKVDLVITSPPYNVGIAYASYKDVQARNDYLQLVERVGQRMVEHLAPGRFAAWNIGVSPDTFPHWQVVTLEGCGFRFARQIVWEKVGVAWPIFSSTVRAKRTRHYKPNFTHEMVYLMEVDAGESDVVLPEVECPVCAGDGRVRGHVGANEHEIVVLVTKDEPELGAKVTPARRYQHDVWKIAQNAAGRDLPTLGHHHWSKGKPARHTIKAHPAAFPPELPYAIMSFLAAPGELVLDPFIGSGTTLVVADEMKRIGYGIELDPIYCELTMRRWEARSGQKAGQVS